MTDDDLPIVRCPCCPATQTDYDGFGVLKCDECGWCSHASAQNGVCGLCGQPVSAAEGRS
jgi:hypothetical protein